MDDWREDALCKETDPEIFFPEPGSGHSRYAAKSVCRMCTVQSDCLWNALETGDNEFGILGGLTAEERRKMLKGMAA